MLLKTKWEHAKEILTGILPTNFLNNNQYPLNLKDENILVAILLSEKGKLVDLLEQYKGSMNNATSLLVRIRER